MKNSKILRLFAVLFAFALVAAACGDDDDDSAAVSDTTVADDDSATEDTSDEMDDDMGGEEAPASSAEICEADAIVEAVESGAEEGTLAGMTDDPVATAASNNPVLTTLVAAVTAANLGDTLNNAEALTVFAPTDCAFAQLDEATLEAALADPEGLLTTVLGFHVIAGERLSADDLAGVTELETFTGEVLTIDGTSLNGGQANVIVPDIMTANATVHLIDAVMLPPSAG